MLSDKSSITVDKTSCYFALYLLRLMKVLPSNFQQYHEGYDDKHFKGYEGFYTRYS